MKTQKQILREKAHTYGLKALTDAEILNILNYKGAEEEFYSSQFFKAAKELLRRQEVKEVVKIKSSGDAYNILSQQKKIFKAMKKHINGCKKHLTHLTKIL